MAMETATQPVVRGATATNAPIKNTPAIPAAATMNAHRVNASTASAVNLLALVAANPAAKLAPVLPMDFVARHLQDSTPTTIVPITAREAVLRTAHAMALGHAGSMQTTPCARGPFVITAMLKGTPFAQAVPARRLPR